MLAVRFVLVGASAGKRRRQVFHAARGSHRIADRQPRESFSGVPVANLPSSFPTVPVAKRIAIHDADTRPTEGDSHHRAVGSTSKQRGNVGVYRLHNDVILGLPRSKRSWSKGEGGLVHGRDALAPGVHAIETHVDIVGVLGTQASKPKASHRVVGVAIAKADECGQSPVANASPIGPVGQGKVESVLLVVAPAPWLTCQSVQGCPALVLGVATGLLSRDRRRRWCNPGWLGVLWGTAPTCHNGVCQEQPPCRSVENGHVGQRCLIRLRTQPGNELLDARCG